MSYTWYHLLHMITAFLFVATTFAAIANPDPARRKCAMRNSGILALLVLVTGFGLLGMMKLGMPLWAIIKTVCWLLLSIITALVFRKPERAKVLGMLATIVVIAALTMVALKPF